MPEKPTYEELEQRILELEAAEATQKELMNAFRQSESRLNQAQRIAKIGSWDMNIETGEGFWSDELFRLLGYQPGEKTASYSLFREHVHPDDIHQFEENLIEYTSRVKHVDETFRFRTTGGDTLYAHSNGNIEFNGAGKPLRAYGTFQDITENKKAELALRKSEQRLQAVLDSVDGVPIQVYDKERRVIFWNPASEKLYGYSHDEAMGNALEELIIPEESRQAVVEGIRQWHDQGVPIPAGEIELLNKKGERLKVYSNHVLITNHRGEKEMFCIDVDLTKIRQVEHRMTSISTVVDNTDNIVVVKDLNLRVVATNAAFAKAAGHTTVDTMIGKTDAEIFGVTPDTEPIRSYMEDDRRAQTLPPGEYIRREEPVVSPDGGVRTFLTKKYPIYDQSGILLGTGNISTDITELKQANTEREKLQEQLNQAQKMESVGRLAGGVAHDFNNMLGVILGHTELALLQADESHDLYSDLKEIQTAAQRSADITKQLLAFARKQTISPKQIDLNDTVENMLNMLRRLIGENIDLVWKPSTHIWPIKMDPTQVDQILANLCVNARDAIDGVGNVTIETGISAIDEEYCKKHQGFIPGDYVQLAVSDNGCGMDNNTLENLFEPFYTTKEIGKGTGLGLATVYGIVKQNNGFIYVDSDTGQGSTFNIYLPPMVENEEDDQTVFSKKLTAGGTETILLVEDEPSILRMTRKMLETKGYIMLTATTPTAALEKAKNHSGSIDLLLTDVVMPEMNGRDLAGQISALYPDIQLLFMSGYTADIIAHQGVLDAGIAFIQKPFSMVDMTAKVRQVLDMAPDKS